MMHKYFNVFVTPMKRWFPQPVTFWRSDNKEGLFAKREKPLGYWLGHVVGYLILALLTWAVVHVVIADDAVISWTPPNERTDGTPLPAAEIGGYILRADGNIIADSIPGSDTNYTVTGLVPREYCFDMATKDSEGRTGPFSSAVCKSVRDIPASPSSIDVLIVPR